MDPVALITLPESKVKEDGDDSLFRIGSLIFRKVDKGTIYARTVVTDLRTLTGAEEEYQRGIDAFNSRRRKFPRHTGKTLKDALNGALARRMGRRSSHESWMNKVNNEPRGTHFHPFHEKPYVHTNRRNGK